MQPAAGQAAEHQQLAAPAWQLFGQHSEESPSPTGVHASSWDKNIPQAPRLLTMSGTTATGTSSRIHATWSGALLALEEQPQLHPDRGLMLPAVEEVFQPPSQTASMIEPPLITRWTAEDKETRRQRFLQLAAELSREAPGLERVLEIGERIKEQFSDLVIEERYRES